MKLTRARSGNLVAWGAPALAALIVVGAVVATSGDDRKESPSTSAVHRSATSVRSSSSPTSTADDSQAGPAAAGTGLRPPGGDLELGAPVDAGRHRVPVSGTEVEVDEGPLTGLRLEFPPGAYDRAVALELSSREITGHTYGSILDPASPLVTVNNAEQVSAGAVAVTLPVEVPDGSLAMAFLHDDTTGELEGLPIVARDEHSITFLTRHFSSFFVSVVAEALLPPEGATYFRAYEAGWQFPNHGSYVSRGGHSAGMSIAAMWYYVEQTVERDAPPLFGRFDNDGRDPTPDYWLDDAQALRFASTVQEDTWWSGLLNRFFRYARTTGFDRLQWDAFRYSLIVTGEPQYVSIAFPDPADPTTVGGGHAMVLYAYSPTSLYVYDPNHPKAIRSITFDDAVRSIRALLLVAEGRRRRARLPLDRLCREDGDARLGRHRDALRGDGDRIGRRRSLPALLDQGDRDAVRRNETARPTR